MILNAESFVVDSATAFLPHEAGSHNANYVVQRLLVSGGKAENGHESSVIHAGVVGNEYIVLVSSAVKTSLGRLVICDIGLASSVLKSVIGCGCDQSL